MSKIFMEHHTHKRFEAIQHCLVPRSRTFNDSQRRQSCQLINDLLKEKGTLLHLKIRAFLILIDIISLLFGGHLFASLKTEKQTRVMNFFFDSPLKILRIGFWGLNTLAKLGVYAQPSVYNDIHYQLREIKHV